MSAVGGENEFAGLQIADVIHALRGDLVQHLALDELRDHDGANAAYERLTQRLADMPLRLKDEVLVALLARQAYALAHQLIIRTQQDIDAMTGSGGAA